MTEESSLSEDKRFCECGCRTIIDAFWIDKRGIDKKPRPRRFKKGHKGDKSRGSNASSWKGGRTINGCGYFEILNRKHHYASKKGYVLEHRLIWENYHKVNLLPWAVVHHINGDRTDNRIENLQLMTRTEHSKHHNSKDMSNRTCFLCNTTKTYVMPKGYPHWYRHPITKEEWLCKMCHQKIRRKLKYL